MLTIHKQLSHYEFIGHFLCSLQKTTFYWRYMKIFYMNLTFREVSRASASVSSFAVVSFKIHQAKYIALSDDWLSLIKFLNNCLSCLSPKTSKLNLVDMGYFSTLLLSLCYFYWFWIRYEPGWTNPETYFDKCGLLNSSFLVRKSHKSLSCNIDDLYL